MIYLVNHLEETLRIGCFKNCHFAKKTKQTSHVFSPCHGCSNLYPPVSTVSVFWLRRAWLQVPSHCVDSEFGLLDWIAATITISNDLLTLSETAVTPLKNDENG